MFHEALVLEYTHSRAFLDPLGLPAGTELAVTPLGQGEYNVNYRFVHPRTGAPLVLRINTGSQMHLDDQIAYEYAALCDLAPSGRTPRPLFCDDTRSALPYGALVMEWLPGRPLRYETDLPQAAAILADIHALPVPQGSRLLRPDDPVGSIYEECLSMSAHYFSWDKADPAVCRLLDAMIAEIGRLVRESGAPGLRCMVNTELNSGNFLIQAGGHSHLVDWEKPLISEPCQDLGHFLAPTTTLWKTDTVLGPAEIGAFVRQYEAALRGRLDAAMLRARLPVYFTVTCLRGITWCAMALREYDRPDRPLTNADTRRKLHQYVSPEFLEHILTRYVTRNFLREGDMP